MPRRTPAAIQALREAAGTCVFVGLILRAVLERSTEGARETPGEIQVTRDLRMEVTYPDEITRVWRALTDPQALKEWLMDSNFEPRVGHRFEFRTKPRRGFSGVIPCEVLRVEEPRLLSFTWGRSDSIVTFRLEEIENGTRLHLKHEGFSGVRGIAMLLVLGRGWKSKLRLQLAQSLQRMRMIG